MSRPVSIIMSCYNEEATVSRAIESMLKQSYSNFEFLIVDDGSVDDTVKIVSEYATRDDRIQFLQNEENRGLSKSLNRAIEQSSGKYIARMDADDLSHSNRLQKQFNFLESNPNIDILGTGINPYSPESNKVMDAIFLPEKHNDIIARVFRKTLVFHPTIMLRRSVFKTCGKYDPNLRWAEDADLWFRIYDQVVFHNLPEALLTYTIKSKLNWHIVKHNFQVKVENLKKREMLIKHSPMLLIDTVSQLSQIVFQR